MCLNVCIFKMAEFGIGQKQSGTLERNGVVVDSIDKSQVAAVIFTSYRDRLYLVPSALIGQVDRDVLKTMSKSQRNRLYQNFAIGDNVDFEADHNGIVTWICKSAPIREINLSSDGKLVFNTVGVLSDEVERQFWTKGYGTVKVKDDMLSCIMPNVPLNCTVEIELDYGEQEGQMVYYLCNFRPKFLFYLHSFIGVSLDFDALYDTPWNKDKKFHLMNKSMKTSASSENIFAETASRRAEHKLIKNVKCVAISKMELYSLAFPKQKIMVAYHPADEENGFNVGALLLANIYFCPISDCLVAYGYSADGNGLNVKMDYYWQHKFQVILTYNENEITYNNEHFGTIMDSYKLMPTTSADGRKIEAWVAAQPSDDLKFVTPVVVHVGNRKVPPKKPMDNDKAKKMDMPTITVNGTSPPSSSNNDLVTEFSAKMTVTADAATQPDEDSSEDLAFQAKTLSYDLLNSIGRFTQSYRILQEHDLLDDFFVLYSNIYH